MGGRHPGRKARPGAAKKQSEVRRRRGRRRAQTDRLGRRFLQASRRLRGQAVNKLQRGRPALHGLRRQHVHNPRASRGRGDRKGERSRGWRLLSLEC